MDRIVNRRDLAFQLYEVLDAEALTSYPRFADHGRDTFDAVIDTAERLALDKFAPHAAKADAEEPRFDGQRVHMIPEIGQALDAYVAAGFMAAHRDEADGGMALPWTIAQACAALFTGANASTTAYPFLTIAAANLLSVHGNRDQRSRYLQPMLEGRFFGTMCLSEPQAGSSLGDIRTRAEPMGAGRYRLKGAKMWISGGDHELSETIVHLVLARLPDAPPGVKGISLFIVPKHHVDDAGQVGARNDVALAGLNHKMGYRGTTNCLLNFGERDGAVGELVGEPHKGLSYMFHMMNEARVGVGLGATMMGYAGYLYSLDYARNRPQGRRPDQKDPASPPVAIIEHADVRRMLMQQKVYVEGALALTLHCARLIDQRDQTEDAEARAALVRLLDILTPIAKAWPSEYCLDANRLAIQVLGGYGYTRDYPVERLYRDNRLNPIHEGTNGIQGLDLLGRKAMIDGGAAFKALMAEIEATLAAAEAVHAVAPLRNALARLARRAALITADLGRLAAGGDVATALANSTPYLDMMGHTVIGWMWLRQALVAAAALDAGPAAGDRAFYEGKLAAARFFAAQEIPRADAQAAILESHDRSALDIDDAGF
ncbi:butyryl-CoA dehydrogenase [Rhodothalassium salexigens DSM 2132]|uniref:Butyryl-CoA dehydrogenase n=1 Tax=Rhodothalassium salexigens DSM 2132 TaxID=1188247 RepID=A0A4R2PT40_RHOSA|nr:acyl-CoA dehydrogenase [Rhodothalassium salexigens]MBB4210119.1 butyryl-CoA dehydrogenase [Rhodothalassium salexigens DSM 2132]MBK1638443.1 acyl-CoA dehydrogenase [Rhodothalassium salexigens DSM 2132]TCP38284.1 butyryl-CoA dehydrogenase [Rhodothalassium salexigens DSM 2132]